MTAEVSIILTIYRVNRNSSSLSSLKPTSPASHADPEGFSTGDVWLAHRPAAWFFTESTIIELKELIFIS